VAALPSLLGTWRSSLGQKLEIAAVDSASGAVHGLYHSPFGEAERGRTYPLVGWLNGPAPEEAPSDVLAVVTFAVRFEGHGSLVAWAGTLASRDGALPLSTLWHSARTGSGLWEHIVTHYENWTLASAGRATQ
jgi:Avidin family